MEKKFYLYFQSVIKFLNSVTIKFDPFVDRMNDYYSSTITIDESDPSTYPYYINVIGEYHNADTPIYITDFTNKTQIELTKANIENNVIRKRYLTDFSLYKDLLKKYPTQKNLIRCIFFPIKYNQGEAIAAPNFTLLGYDETFLNEKERDNIIFDLEDFLEYYGYRWYINTFNYEELYPLANWSILWTVLPLFLLYKKIHYIKTGNVDDFHLWEYLTSKGLKDYTGYLTSQQNVYFYRNIDFLIGNLGKTLVTESLDEVLLKPIGLTLQSKWIYHDLLNGKINAHWNPISTNKDLKNTDKILRIDAFNNLLIDIEEDGLDTDRYPEYKSDIKNKFTFTKYNHLITKYQEIITTLKDFKYYQFYIRFISDNIFSLDKDDRLDLNINLINDVDTDLMISITHEDAINLLYYIYYLKAKVTPMYLPTLYTSTIGINHLERPTIVDDFRYQTEPYKISDYINIDEVLNTITYVDSEYVFEDKASLSDFINDRFDLWVQLTVLKRNSHSRIKRYAITNLINQICHQETFEINPNLNTYEDYFILKPYLKEFLLKYETSTESYDNLIYQIFNNFIDINSNIKNYIISTAVKDLQFQKMKQLFIQFNSYLIRLLDNVLMHQEYITLPTITVSLGEINTLIQTAWNYPSKGYLVKMSEFLLSVKVLNISWDDDNHEENESYTMTIIAQGPQGQDLTYEVVCDDPAVGVVQSGTPNIWDITYGEYDEDTDVVYTITVIDEDLNFDTMIDNKTVHDIILIEERGIFGGGGISGNPFLNEIKYITISTPGDATDFGDLTTHRQLLAATSNGANDRGIFGGGYGEGTRDEIEYITISTIGNAIDFGDLSAIRHYLSAISNGVNDRGVFSGGRAMTQTNIIDYITISTIGNALDFGDLNEEKYGVAACSNGVNDRGIIGGGWTIIVINVIEYVTISTPGDALDFGDLFIARYGLAATSNGINERGIIGGGWAENNIEIIDYITISTIGNAVSFGNLSIARSDLAATSNGVNERGVFVGGWSTTYSNDIDYITISSLGDAIDFGDLTNGKFGLAATSNA